MARCSQPPAREGPMAGKHGAGEARRRRQGEADPPASGSQPRSRGSSKKGGSKGPLGWPWWLWVTGSFALVACLGQLFVGSSPPADHQGGSSQKKADKAGKAGKASSKPKTSTARYLELALRLQEMTEVASTLEAAGALDSDAARELDQELSSIEGEVDGAQGSVARDIRAMVSVVRGTLFQRGENLTDEQVEKLQNSYTYANPRYWDDYYNKTSEAERFDWYGSWDTLVQETAATSDSGEEQPPASPAETIGELVKPYLSPESKILMLGCGNSNMSEQMYMAGFEHIVNVDISERLLENLRTRLGSAMPNMRWVYMNASALDFQDGQFDVTIDKGTLDALEQNKPLLRAAAAEAHRTLRPGGLLLSVTFNSAEVRLAGQLREAASWGDCRTHTFERASTRAEGKSTYYLHACRRPA